MEYRTVCHYGSKLISFGREANLCPYDLHINKDPILQKIHDELLDIPHLTQIRYEYTNQIMYNTWDSNYYPQMP